MAANQLPKLLYVSDVPAEATYHGSALIYRLLQNWSPAELRVIESSLSPSKPNRRLPSIQYAELKGGNRRLLHTRFANWYSAWLMKAAEGRTGHLTSLHPDYYPEAVLTVAHGYSWITAASFANKQRLPLHLICHDDLPRTAMIPKSWNSWLDRKFGNVYRQAATRFCVSPFMRDTYYERYGTKSSVLYPSRAADAPRFEMPPERTRSVGHRFTIAFAGTVNTPGYGRALVEVANALKPLGGRLAIFGPLTRKSARALGLDRVEVELKGMVSSNDLILRLRNEIDALFVPMSFTASDKVNMQMGFPSKLTDCTAVGLPLLIYGPEYCSAVRWARENPGVAEVVSSESAGALNEPIRRLAIDPEFGANLGKRALETGDRYFSYNMAHEIFYGALLSKSQPATNSHLN